MISGNHRLSTISPSIKQATLQGVPLGGPFLDIPVKVHTSDIDNVLGEDTLRFALEVNTIIFLDGLSIRRLNLADVRNSLVIKNQGKVSLKGEKNQMKKIGSEVTDIALKSVGASFLTPAFKLGRILVQRTGVLGNHDDESRFQATLRLKGDTPRDIGRVDVGFKKWNSYKEQGDEDIFSAEIEDLVGNCALRSRIILDIERIPGVQVTSRLNVPFFGLNRDHGNDVIITTATAVQVSLSTGEKTDFMHSWDQFNLGKVGYPKIALPNSGYVTEES